MIQYADMATGRRPGHERILELLAFIDSLQEVVEQPEPVLDEKENERNVLQGNGGSVL